MTLLGKCRNVPKLFQICGFQITLTRSEKNLSFSAVMFKIGDCKFRNRVYVKICFDLQLEKVVSKYCVGDILISTTRYEYETPLYFLSRLIFTSPKKEKNSKFCLSS